MNSDKRMVTALASSGFVPTTYGYPHYQDDEGRVLQVKGRVGATRDLEAAIVQLARVADDKGVTQAVLVIRDARIRATLVEIWMATIGLLRPGIAKKLNLIAMTADSVVAVPEKEEWLQLGRALAAPQTGPGSSARFGAFYMVVHVLLSSWLRGGGAMMVKDLGATAGVSQPTVRSALERLGGDVVRDSRRRVRLASLPRQAWAEMATMSARIRESVYFEDPSGRPRSAEQLLARLRKHGPARAAMGGVVAARHWDAQLDLEGIPRLDLCIHAPREALALDFVRRVDAALEPTSDPHASIRLAVHRIRRANPLFVRDAQHHACADPVDTLLDLHELRLYTQAEEMIRRMRSAHERA